MSWETLSELQEYDEVTNSYTNQVYETDGSFVKVFDQVSSTTVARALKTAVKGDFDWVSAEERSVKERNAGQILEPYGIPVPEVIDYGTLDGGKQYVELDSIEGPDAFSFLYNDADTEQAEKFGRIEGHRLNALHQDGISPVDSGWANRIVTDNNVWWIDNEFLTTEATAAEMQGDLEKILQSGLETSRRKIRCSDRRIRTELRRLFLRKRYCRGHNLRHGRRRPAKPKRGNSKHLEKRKFRTFPAGRRGRARNSRTRRRTGNAREGLKN